MTDARALIDLDIWMAERPDGRLCAYTKAEPRFLAVQDDEGPLLVECGRALRDYAMCAGHDIVPTLQVSRRPEGRPVPVAALPAPEGGARVVGRLVLTRLRDGAGRDLLASPFPVPGGASRPGALPRA